MGPLAVGSGRSGEHPAARGAGRGSQDHGQVGGQVRPRPQTVRRREEGEEHNIEEI